MDNSLVLTDVQKTFPGFSLHDVSFSLPRGFVMGFIGPNGAGKTTVIKLILNMLVRDSGSIRVFDQDNLLAEQEIKERIGIVMDETFYVDAWTLKDVGMALKPFYRKWSGERYAALLPFFILFIALFQIPTISGWVGYSFSWKTFSLPTAGASAIWYIGLMLAGLVLLGSSSLISSRIYKARDL